MHLFAVSWFKYEPVSHMMYLCYQCYLVNGSTLSLQNTTDFRFYQNDFASIGAERGPTTYTRQFCVSACGLS